MAVVESTLNEATVLYLTLLEYVLAKYWISNIMKIHAPYNGATWFRGIFKIDSWKGFYTTNNKCLSL